MRANGLKLLIGDEEHVVHPRCTDNARELPPQDFVIICLKAHSITGAIEAMRPLLGARTRIVTAVNGIPYWYFYSDPGGRQWRELGPERAIGCIVYPATEIVAPGVIQHVYGDRFPIGEPSGEDSEDVRHLMNKHHIRHLPVIDNHSLCGVISMRDISSAFDEQAMTAHAAA